MAINRPSLYAAFGDERALFCDAVDRYSEGAAAYVRNALDQSTAQAVIEELFGGAVALLTDPSTPQGCFLVEGALSSGKAAEPIRRELIARLTMGDVALKTRL